MPAETGQPCRVRPFASGDAEAVREIFKASPQAAALASESYARSPEWNGPLALISEVGREVTGFLIGREVAGEAEIFMVAVSPNYRRRGHGGTLLLAAIDCMRSRGVKNVFLEVRESNVSAITLYERLGFSKIGYRKVYYSNPTEAAITMGKKLGD